MNINKEFQEILQEFLEHASPDELEMLLALLKKREKGLNGQANLDVGSMAKNMAQTIQKQLGITSANIRKTAIDLVVDIAKKHQPDITEKELRYIVQKMVPDKNKSRLPKEVLLSMVDHFVSFSLGKMSEEDLQQLPPGWEKKYWDHFPVMVQKLINALLTDVVNEEEFWQTVEQFLAKN